MMYIVNLLSTYFCYSYNLGNANNTYASYSNSVPASFCRSSSDGYAGYGGASGSSSVPVSVILIISAMLVMILHLLVVVYHFLSLL